MQHQKPFGRRAPAQSAVRSFASVPAGPCGSPKTEASVAITYDDGIDREIADWKAARTVRKRSFREPWRSVSIAAGLGFGASSWLLPDSVATIAQLVTFGLSAASIYAGLRRPPIP